MFTGIVDHTAEIMTWNLDENGAHLTVNSFFTELVEGESIAVDGICLTVVEPKEGVFSCDISPETLRCTSAQYFYVGKKLNLERSLRVGDRLGGHFVMGHVDGVLLVKVIEVLGENKKIVFSGLSHYPRLVSYKGSVAINGVSLTVNAVDADTVSVMLIPHTLSRTNLSTLKEGDSVNLELDYLARILIDSCTRSEFAHSHLREESRFSP